LIAKVQFDLSDVMMKQNNQILFIF